MNICCKSLYTHNNVHTIMPLVPVSWEKVFTVSMPLDMSQMKRGTFPLIQWHIPYIQWHLAYGSDEDVARKETK